MLKRNNAIIAAVIGGIFAIIASVIGAYLASTRDTEKPQITEQQIGIKYPNSLIKTQISQRNKNLTENEQREELRSIHGVRKLEIVENELKFLVAPRGVYGFDSMTNYDSNNSSYLNYIRLHREIKYYEFIYFEFHKMKDGTGEIIGFVSPETNTRLTREDRPSGFQATLYNCGWSGAPEIISIPINLIKAQESRSIFLEDNRRIMAVDITLK